MTRIVLLHRGEVIDLIGPYLPALIGELKEEVPFRSRSWNADFKCWTVGERWCETVRRLAGKHADSVLEAHCGTRVEKGPGPVGRDLDADAETLGVSPKAPGEVIHAAYRAMARLHHPDLVGSMSTGRMQEINAAYERMMAARPAERVAGNGR